MGYLFVLSFCFVCFGAYEVAHAQSAAHEKTLLWRVHKAEQAHDSYLYGTMHVRDERAFEFADSVLPALSRCHFFALEQRIDTLLASLMTQIMDTSAGIRLKDIVQGPQLDSLCKIFSNISSIPESKIPNLRCSLLSQILESETHVGNNDRPTLLDAYLLGLARSLRKELMALEGSADNLLMLDKVGAIVIRTALESGALVLPIVDPDKEKAFTVYFDQNIDSIATLFATSMTNHNGLADTLMYQRNIVMAKSFDSLHQVASLFAAIGAGHLGGPSGIIDLLRAKGYTVEAVLPTYTGVRHQFDSVDLSAHATWYDYRSVNRGFSIRMPAQIMDLPQYKELDPTGTIEAPQCLDVITGLRFQVIAQPSNGMTTEVAHKQFADAMARKIYTNPIEKQPRTEAPYLQRYQGRQCYDYFGSVESQTLLRIRIVFTDRNIYTLMAYGSKENINNSSVSGFLNSLEFQALKKQEWAAVHDSVHGVECEMIGRAQVVRDTVSDATPVYYYSEDVSNGNICFYQNSFLSDPTAGSSLEELVKGQLRGNNSEAELRELRFENSPNTDVCAYYSLDADSSGRQHSGRIYIRRRHVYRFDFISTTASYNSEDCSRFLGSVRFLPKRDTAIWREYYDDSTHMTLSFPAEPKKRALSLPELPQFRAAFSWIASNDTASMRCGIIRYEFSPYMYTSNLDLLIQSLVSTFRFDGDTLSGLERNEVDNTTIVDFSIRRKRCDLSTRYRFILRGNMMHLAFAYLHQANKRSVDVDNFFRSIVLAPSNGFNISTPKIQNWYSDFRSARGDRADSLRKVAAWIKAAESDVPFLKAQLLSPQLAEDAEYAKSDCGRGVDGPLRSVLLDKLSYHEDSLSADFVFKLFKSSQRIPAFQCEILRVLSESGKVEIQAALFQLLRSDAQRLSKQPHADFKYLLSQARLSPKNCAQNAKLLVELYQVPLLRGTVISIIQELLRTKQVDSTVIRWTEADLTRDLHSATKRFLSSMTKHAKGGMVKDQAFDDDYQSSELAMVICMWFEGRAFSPATEKALHEAMRGFASEFLPLTQQAAIDLLLHGSAVPDSILLRLVADKELSIRLLGIIDSLKLKTSIPKEYFRQEHVAKCLLGFVVAEEEENDVDSVIILSEHILALDTLSYRYFLIRYHLQTLAGTNPESGEKWYVALVGSFDSARTNLFLREQETYYSSRSYLEQSVEKHLQDCLQNRESEYRRRAKESMRSQQNTP